ncbi:MAG: efflux RND transporter periplasmic adaptor subunit [Candidatus Azobacteroides sp.]|nr:efflux RND transporter periplasmic adaptor subunit [Candidatus Azobacteroides sp.]
MKTNRLFRLIPLLSLCILVACGGKKENNTNVTEKIKVNVTTAELKDLERTSTYTANIKADVINQITPAIPGRIEKIYVEIGNNVSKGQILVQMDASSLNQQNVQLENLKRDYARYEELLKVGGIAQQQVDQIKTQIDVLTTAIKNVEENTRLRSPINGIITNRNYDNGDVYAGQPILTVQQLNPLKLLIYVSESYFTRVKKGMPVNIQLDVYGDEIFTGRVSLIYPTIDLSTHTFGVEVAINNSNMRVRPGMFARVTLNFGTEKGIVVPDMAVQKQSGSNDRYVFTVENGIAKYHRVELGQRTGETQEILSGIKAGDVVVTAGQNRLIDGTEVEIIKN